MNKHLIISILVFTFLALTVIVVSELLAVLFIGKSVPAPKIPREPITIGKGSALTYVVMGDSTSIAQGSDYESGYALASARHVAKNHTVTFINTGISGATTKTVLEAQLEKAMSYKPDLVLLAVGANDTTHFTSATSLKDSAQSIIDGLRSVNPNVRIVMTRSPAMDSVTRFPFISKWVMALRTKQVNKALGAIITKNDLTLAPIAEKTREPFMKDPTLTAQDHFHPNARGYALWIPVVNAALDKAL